MQHRSDSLPSIPSLVGIGFDGSQLTGNIPESYGSFPKLFIGLTLSRNRLSGKIPASLAKLNLAFVDLSRNSLDGDGSVFFGANKDTQKILLARNKLSFDIGKVGLSKDLNALNVSNNNLCGKIPSMLRFDKSCYANNKCLCGSPLPACNT